MIMSFNPKSLNMNYLEFLFVHEILARVYKRMQAESLSSGDRTSAMVYGMAADDFKRMADAFVHTATTGRLSPPCEPGELPPCKWPAPEGASVLIIGSENIEGIDLVLPFRDDHSYSIVIEDSSGNEVVSYTLESTMHRFYRYPAGVSLPNGEYEFVITMDGDITNRYPFKINETNN